MDKQQLYGDYVMWISSDVDCVVGTGNFGQLHASEQQPQNTRKKPGQDVSSLITVFPDRITQTCDCTP